MTIAGVVAAAMLIAPTVAIADVPARTVAAPTDCPATGPVTAGGSGPGDPATAGDEKPAGDEPAGGDASGGEQKPDDSTSADQKSGDDAAGDEKPADEKPAEEKPAEEKPAGEKPGDDASGDETSGEKPEDQKSGGEDESGDSGGSGSSDDSSSEGAAAVPLPAGPAPAASKAAADEPADEKPADEKPADEKPVDVKPAEDKPADEKPADDQTSGSSGAAGKPAPAPADCAVAAGPAPGAVGSGAATSAAVLNKWGQPNRVDEFDKGISGWSAYDGEGHAGNGRRSPDAASVKDGLLTINGDAEGTTAGLAWNPGQKYGRWEGRVKAPVSDPSYNALLLLWPDAENFPVGGEVDFMEMSDHTRQKTEMFLHYGEENSQKQGEVKVDATQWHNWAVEWTPDHITAFLDGKPWWTTTDTSILPPGPMHLCIQLDWFPKGGGDVKPSEMQVDWVKQYSIPESEQGEDTGGSGGDDASEGLRDTLGDLTRATEGAPDPGQTGAGQRGPSGVTATS
ncbi:MAG: family 16 glycosylhydrolase [Pseudonocardia sp.]|nr:family 16 glycosylhydrolase [Pseudonocardia sp.]